MSVAAVKYVTYPHLICIKRAPGTAFSLLLMQLLSFLINTSCVDNVFFFFHFAGGDKYLYKSERMWSVFIIFILADFCFVFSCNWWQCNCNSARVLCTTYLWRVCVRIILRLLFSDRLIVRLNELYDGKKRQQDIIPFCIWIGYPPLLSTARCIWPTLIQLSKKTHKKIKHVIHGTYMVN